MGKTGQSLKSITLEQPRLQAQLKWLVRDFALVGMAVALLVGLLRSSWLQAGLGGIAIGMSVLPEEIPLVLAVFMAMGAWRISHAGVLTRRAAAIETLGSATILCTDKTGTLTENQMQVTLIAGDSQVWRSGGPMDDKTADLLYAALGASAPLPTDPMDRAIHQAAALAEQQAPQGLLQSYALRPELLSTANLWNADNGVELVAHAKGAPEAIAELCRLSPEARARLMEQVEGFATQGLRLLAVAQAQFAPQGGVHPQSQRDMPLRYMGLLGFADPLRATVPAAVREYKGAGIRFIMITGDHPVTARAIAAQAGIDGGAVLTGDMLEAMNDDELALEARTTSVFARIRPQQNLRLVEALKRDGEIVAMTGDGVNDAPAMKAAHIGIAMGGRGTDVAREASALVLLHDDFASIVATIRLGRRIYDNMRKAIAYIVAVHVPIAGMALLPILCGMPLILMPIQILLLEMVIDPACSVVFESEREERDVMHRPPRKPGAPVLPAGAAMWAGIQGLVALAIGAGALFAGTGLGMGPNDLRALVFTILVVMNIGLILVNRSFRSSLVEAVLRPNPALWILVCVVALILSAALYWPPMQALFHFSPLHLDDLAGCPAPVPAGKRQAVGIYAAG